MITKRMNGWSIADNLIDNWINKVNTYKAIMYRAIKRINALNDDYY